MKTRRRIRNATGELRPQDDVMRDLEELIRVNPSVTNREIGNRLGYHYNRIGKLRKLLEGQHRAVTRAELDEEKVQQLNAEVQRLWRIYEDSRMVSKVLDGQLSPSEVRRIVGISEKAERDLEEYHKIKAREWEQDSEREHALKVRIPKRLSEKEKASHFGKSVDFMVAVSAEGEADRIASSIEKRLANEVMTQSERQELLAEMTLLEKYVEENTVDPKLDALVQELGTTWSFLLELEARYRRREAPEKIRDTEEREEKKRQLAAKQRGKKELLSILRKKLPGFKINQAHPGLVEDKELISALDEAFERGNRDLVLVIAARHQVAYLLNTIKRNYPALELNVHYYQREKAKK